MYLSKKEKVDRFILIAVLLQPLLILFQWLMIDVLHMSAEQTTVYRVAFSAIPMSVAIAVSFFRKPFMFISVYTVVIMLLLLHSIVFPENYQYLWQEALRFTLPMVISSALCVVTVGRIDLFEKILYVISWVAVIEIAIYVISYLRGDFLIADYNMSFSYACLFPMISLYRRRKSLPVLFSLLIFVIVVAIGSRGAAIIFSVYLIFDIIQRNRKLLIPLVVVLVSLPALLPFLIDFFDSIGLHSRTLAHFTSGQMGRVDDRTPLYDAGWKSILDSPFLGTGLWGDRAMLNGAYIHNIIIEILMDFGLLIGGSLILFFIVSLSIKFLGLDGKHKNDMIAYTLMCIAPLMFSNSYLISPEFGIFVGLMIVLFQNNKSASVLKN